MVQNGKGPANPEVGGRRRMRSKQERRQVVEETMRPGAPSVAVIARAHGVNANQVFNWRKLYYASRLNEKLPATELLPVRISDVPGNDCSTGKHTSTRSVSGAIHIEFGRTRIRVEGSVDPETLRMILEHLGR
jgi:transposase